MTTLKTHWPVHPVAELFPTKMPEERAEMKKDMQDRATSDLDPLESPILLWDNQILDGRHRDELWMELAEENACGGYFARMRPPTEDFKPGKQGTLTAWMRAKSRNMMVRQTPAGQRAAIFLKAVNAYPELKAVLEGIKQENIKRKMKGQPLGAGDQRGNTNEEVAKMANVGTTTMKQVKQLEKEAPDKFEEVAKGKTTAKKALKEVKKKKQAKPATRTAKVAASTKPQALTCTVQFELLPGKDMALEEVVNRLRMHKAEFRGLYVWLKNGKTVAVAPGTSLPKGCLAEVTGILAAKDFKLEA